MVNITLKNVPHSIHRQLKKQAALHRRSLNGEILACLERNVGNVKVDVDAMLAEARSLRKKISGRLTDRLLKRIKNEGRP